MSLRLAAALLLALAPLASAMDEPGVLQVASLDAPASLAGRWRFRAGDDPAWAEPALDDERWATLAVPGDWGRQGYPGYEGFGWYRLELRLPPADGRPLMVSIGKVHSAYELYADGRRVGARGRFPPDAVTRYDQDGLWPIPESLAADGRVVLALRVWRGNTLARPWQGGPYEGAFLVGRAEDVVAVHWRARQLALLLTGLYAVVGAYHVYLFRRRRVLREYLWYGLLTMAIGLYALLTSPWRFDLPLPWMPMKKVEYAVLYALAPLAMQTMWALLEVRPGRVVRVYQSAFVVLAAAGLAAPDLLFLFHTLDLWQLLILPAIFYLAGLVVWRARQGHAEARTLLAGVILFSITALNDVAVDRHLLVSPRLVPIGFAAFILSMAVSLANRFTRVFSELEARTRELQRAQADLLRTEKLSAIGGMAAGLVHDLRNPVAAVHSYATLIAASSTPAQKQMLQRILDETTRSVDMMEDVLAFARGHVHVAVKTVDLGAWLAELHAYLVRELEIAGLEVTLAGDTSGTASFDPGRLRRVLCNLAWNARDAMPDGGRFEIAVRREPGFLEIACTDDGPGVPPEIVDRLFAEFATWGKANGTGLGLALSRSIVQEHGGTLRHEPVAPHGARFVVRLPA